LVTDLRVAIAGYGLAGRRFHAPLVAATDGLSVAFVVTRDADRASAVGREHPGAIVVASTDELWERGGVGVLVVATPNELHAPLALEAISRGVPVVVDKPMALNAAQAQELVDAAERAGVMLAPFHNRRWDSDQRTLRRLMADGRLGDIYRYESRFERWRPAAQGGSWREDLPPERGGGQLLDLGTHLFDQALALFGPVSEVYAEIDARRGLASDDDDFVVLRHGGGTISHLHASAVTAAPGPRLRVLGSEAAFVVDGLDGQEDALRAGRRPDDEEGWGVEPESRWGRLVRGDVSEPVPSERGDWPRFYSELAVALRNGGPPPIDPRDAVAGMRLVEAARQSADRRFVIEV
jgi:scyllo-inositol 2-dehydrogenase (NADP+)